MSIYTITGSAIMTQTAYSDDVIINQSKNGIQYGNKIFYIINKR